MFKFNVFTGTFDIVNKNQAATQQFSFKKIEESEVVTVPTNQQMLVDGHTTVLGHLTIVGQLVDISNRKSEKYFYDKIIENEVVEVEQNRLLEYNQHLTVLGHLRVNGRLVDTEKINAQLTFGKATLGSGGNATVLTSAIHSTSNVQLTASLSPLNGKLHYDTVIDSVSFNIHTGNNSDNGLIIDWLIAN